MGSLKEGKWSCYRGGQFNGEMVILGGGHFNEGRMVMLHKSPVQWRENGHVTEEVSIMEGE